MFGIGTSLVIAAIVAILGSLSVAKCEHTRADTNAELVKTQTQTIKELRGQIDDRDGRIKEANRQTDAANARIDDLARQSKKRLDAGTAARSKAEHDAAAARALDQAILSAPRSNPDNACASACSQLRSPL